MDVFAGTCHPPSPTYISRAAALASGIPADVPVSAVNRLCGSGLQAIRIISSAIQAGNITLGMAVGVESMSQKYAMYIHLEAGIDMYARYVVQDQPRKSHHQSMQTLKRTTVCSLWVGHLRWLRRRTRYLDKSRTSMRSSHIPAPRGSVLVFGMLVATP